MAERPPMYQSNIDMVVLGMAEDSEVQVQLIEQQLQDIPKTQNENPMKRRTFLKVTAVSVANLFLPKSSMRSSAQPDTQPTVSKSESKKEVKALHSTFLKILKREPRTRASLPTVNVDYLIDKPQPSLKKDTPPKTGEGYNPLFDSPDEEVRNYGEFAIGNRENLTKDYIKTLLESKMAAHQDLDTLAEKMLDWETKYGVGSEYVITLLLQETKLGRDIVEGKAPLSGKNNWANYGRPETIKDGKFPDWTKDENGKPFANGQEAIEDNIETVYWQMDKNHRRGIQTVEPVKKFYHTWAGFLPSYAPLKSNPNLTERIKDGEEFITQIREESKKS